MPKILPVNLDLENGVQLPEYREQTFVRALLRLRAPEVIAVPLSGFGGEKMIPIIRVGETVAKNAMLAKSKSGLDWIVSPVSGKLRGVERLAHPLLGSVLCAFLAVKDNVPALETRGHNPSAMTAAGVIQAARVACIIDELDGLPLYYKLQTAMRDKVLMVVADGIDDTPWITSSIKTVLEYGDIACDGVGMALKVLGGGKAVLAVHESSDIDMSSVVGNFGFIEVVPIGGGYPVWPRFERKYCGGRPCLRVGVQALRALSDAVREGLPQTETIITVTGDCVRNPANIVVTTGTPVSYVLEEVGISREPKYVIIGDTMTGVACSSLDIPVIPGMRGITVMSSLPSVPEKTRCISCGRCVTVCPERLFPSEAVRLYERGAKKQAAEFGAKKCTGCGACSAVCPAGIEISDMMLGLAETAGA